MPYQGWVDAHLDASGRESSHAKQLDTVAALKGSIATGLIATRTSHTAP
jgi:hypothetical protein